MKITKWAYLILLIMGVISTSCQKTPVESKTKNLSIQNEISKVLELVLSEPDSIPKKIQDILVTEARRRECDGIHIVNAIRETQKSKYCVTFFNDIAGPVDRILMDTEGEIEYLTDAEKDYLGANWESKSLKKNQTTLCREPAKVWKNAYFGGTNFLFTQAGYCVTGTFAKLIDNLHDASQCDYCTYCKGGPFPGPFSNCISSHQWTFGQNYVEATTIKSSHNKYGFIVHMMEMDMNTVSAAVRIIMTTIMPMRIFTRNFRATFRLV